MKLISSVLKGGALAITALTIATTPAHAAPYNSNMAIAPESQPYFGPGPVIPEHHNPIPFGPGPVIPNHHNHISFGPGPVIPEHHSQIPFGPGPVVPEQQSVHNRGEIHFQPGATTASVQGFLGSNESDHYTFSARQGQPSDIYVSSPNGKGDLTLIAPNGQVLASANQEITDWHGTLPVTGTYQANVSNGHGSEVGYYTLHLNIKPN
ncbi:MAG: PPC domain-containing protein [Cyanobacteria bacterium P01_H01_bin.121]